jgi:hypothetical protein
MKSKTPNKKATPTLAPDLMANTFTGTMCSFCCDVILSELCAVLAPLNNFTNDCSGDPMSPLRPIIVSVATTQSPVNVNPTDYTTGAGATMRPITIQPQILSVPYAITATELNQGYKLESLVRVNAQKLGLAIWDIVLPYIKNDATTPAVPPNKFPSTNKVVKTLASFGPNDIGTLYGLIKCGPKHLILSSEAIGKMMYVTGGCCFPLTGGSGGASAFGFSSITEHSSWALAEPNIYGFAYCPGAIVIASGVPLIGPACTGVIDTSTVTLPGLGLTVQVNTWCDPSKRGVFQSLDIVFGANFGIACQGATLVTA